MPVAYNYKKGIDLPAWQWIAQFPGGNSNNGTSNVYDGKRFFYWVVQTGSTTTAAATTSLWQYDTWTNGWQFLVNLTSGNQGMDLEYDSIRNVLYYMAGAALTTWQTYNLNTTAVTIANQSCAARALTTMTTVLPAASALGSSFTMPSDDVVPVTTDNGTADVTGNTTTNVQATAATGTFSSGYIGMQLRVTSGAQTGQKRTISAVPTLSSITVAPALPGALASGDTFVVEQVEDIATAGAVGTVTDTTSSWITNQYANMDVIITGGTGSGQRRRIASNTATVLTLAAAVTGNTRTGNFTTAPDATSTYKIVPSSDFLYYQVGGSTALWKIDVAQTTGVAFTALTAAPAATGGGANTFYPANYSPYSIFAVRGAATANIYLYNIGTNAWTTPAVYSGESFTTGATACLISGKRKILFQKESSTRLISYDILTGIMEAAGTVPYAAPGAFDGKRARVITSTDGAQFLYIMRAGGPEFFRVPLEWL